MTSAAASSLKEYLKRYQSGAGNDDKRKKKKKKIPKVPAFTGGGVLIVDEDPTWQRPVVLEEDEADEDNSAGENNPVVDEDIEVKRLRRLEAIRAKKPYLSVSEDGSGWVSVSDSKGGSLVDSEFPARGNSGSPSPENDGGCPDLSLPRQARRRRFLTPSPERREGISRPTKGSDVMREDSFRRSRHEEDISPPRRGCRSSVDVEVSPRRIVHGRSPAVDFSPPRRVSRHGFGEGILPPRRAGSYVEIDTSPHRRAPADSPELDLSPPRRDRRISPGSDLSPPRRAQSRSSGTKVSPNRRVRRVSSHSEVSPPRHAGRSSPGSDLSPVRRVRRSSPKGDLKLPNHRRGNIKKSDLSQARTGRSSVDSDLSPPRAGQRRDGSSPENLSLQKKHRIMPDDDCKLLTRSSFGSPKLDGKDISPPRRKEKNSDIMKMGSSRPCVDHSPERGRSSKPLEEGKRKGGLYTGSQIREEIHSKKEENIARFESLDPAKSGKGAAPVYRNQGKRISKEEKFKLEKGEEKPKEMKLEWGKGLAQKREAEEEVLELELEKERPFARSRDDPELDKMLKDRIRWGDPMAHLIKKKDSEMLIKDFGDDEKMKESGFIIPQTIPSHSWMKRGIDPPPNRYGIKPGRHWDGVDRSTGYEKELFKRLNEKKATQTEAYLWSVADM